MGGGGGKEGVDKNNVILSTVCLMPLVSFAICTPFD